MELLSNLTPVFRNVFFYQADDVADSVKLRQFIVCDCYLPEFFEFVPQFEKVEGCKADVFDNSRIDIKTFKLDPPIWRYCNKLWIRFSGGVLGDFLSVSELDSLNDVRQYA